jgi:hypothetical protein
MDQGIIYTKRQKLLDIGFIRRNDGDEKDDSAASSALPSPGGSLSICSAQSVSGGRKIL